MRKVLPFVLLLLPLSNCLGQELRIGAIVQPDLTYFTVRPDASTLASDFKMQNKPLIGYQLGLVFFREMSDKVTLVYGLVYSKRGLESQFNTSTIAAFNFGSGYALKIIDHYLEIPLSANYYLQKNSRVSWFVSAGLKPALYLNSVSKASGISNTPTNYVYSAHRKVNVFVTLGGGMEVNINDKWQCVLWPSLEHALLKEVYAAPLSLYPYSLGMNVCLLYSLGN
jgi:hypothetical protein